MSSIRVPWQGLLLGVGYTALMLALWPTETRFWLLPFGLRYGALLLCPPRWWGWLIGGELAAALLNDLGSGMLPGWESFLCGDLPEPLVVAACVAVLRRGRSAASLRDPGDVARLLLSATLVIALVTLVEAAMLALVHRQPNQDMLLDAAGDSLLGDYVGVLLLVPPMVMLARAMPARHAAFALAMDLLRVLLPALAILVIMSGDPAPLPQYARILSLAPTLLFAFRHGWRGAGVSMALLSIGMNVFDRLGHQPTATAPTYLFLAVSGSGALLLGAATDALRRSSQRVAEQNAYLEAVNRRLDRLARQLRDAARGNLEAEEARRRHMAAELHDELGQNLTAIQTHVKLAQSRLQAAGLDDVGSAVNTILGHMRRVLHRMLDDLRPAALDEFGLFRALDEGPIRDLLLAARIAYRTDLRGDPGLLDEATRTAVYRLVQESATNAVKHAQASRFDLRLRIGERAGATLALLDLHDDGIGLSATSQGGGRGMQGMRDRVTSLGGLFRLRQEHGGTHLRVLLRSTPAGLLANPGVPRQLGTGRLA